MTLPNLEKSRNMGLVGMYIPHRVAADNTEGGGGPHGTYRVNNLVIGKIECTVHLYSVAQFYIQLLLKPNLGT